MSSPLPLSSSEAPYAHKRKRSSRVSAGRSGGSLNVGLESSQAYSASDVPTPVPSSVPAKKKARVARRERVVSDESDRMVAPSPGAVAYNQLPPVTISHPAGDAARSLQVPMTYGELAAAYIAAVAPAGRIGHPLPAPTEQHLVNQPAAFGAADVDDVVSASDASEGSLSDGSEDTSARSADLNPYVDNMAEERSDSSSDAGSELEGSDGDIGDDESTLPSVPTPLPHVPVIEESVPAHMSPHVSGRPKTKTEKGRYVDVLLQDGQASDLAVTDNVKADPSVVPSSAKRGRRTRVRPPPVEHGQACVPPTAVSVDEVASGTAALRRDPVPAPAVYLEDLEGPPLPTSTRAKGKKRNPKLLDGDAAGMGRLKIHTNYAALESDSKQSPFKTLVTDKVSDPSCVPSLRPVPSDVHASQGAPCGTAQMQAVGSALAAAVAPPMPAASGSSNALFDALDALLGDDCLESSSEEEDIPEPPAEDVPQAPASADTADNDPWKSYDEPADVTLRVMLPEIQEEHLRSHYAALATLGPFRPIVPLGQTVDSFPQPAFLSLDTVRTLFSKGAHRSVAAWHRFTSYAPYCNLSTLPIPSIATDGLKILLANRAAVSLTAGVIIDSFLVKVGQKGGYKGDTAFQGGNRLHGVRLLPFHQPWRRETTTMCAAFDRKVGHSPYMKEDGMDFVTRQFSAASLTNRNKYPSPIAVSGSAPTATPSGSTSGWPRSPTKSSTLVSPKNDFYHCLGFNDDVPVFDGRASGPHHFLFRDEDFDKLPSLPRYQAGKDLDRFTLVAVGHTPSIWCPGENMVPRITLNVQFIIVLGQAPKAAKLATLGFGAE